MDEKPLLAADDEKFLTTLNWGALVLTPLWLFRNGFWLTMALYFLLGWVLGLLGSAALSLLFFFKGSRWSWGNGKRWNSFDEFARSQQGWNLTGQIVLLLLVFWWAYLIYSLGFAAFADTPWPR